MRLCVALAALGRRHASGTEIVEFSEMVQTKSDAGMWTRHLRERTTEGGRHHTKAETDQRVRPYRATERVIIST